ncbi:MAG: PilZ domain-containing protein [Bdellovibrio sp.]|jgi:hypothetical protein
MEPAPRHPTKEMAAVEIYGRNGQMIMSVRNMSASGACLEWKHEDYEIRQGDLIRMTIVLRSLNRKHHVNAEVMWREGNRTGVSFIASNRVLDRLLEKGVAA